MNYIDKLTMNANILNLPELNAKLAGMREVLETLDQRKIPDHQLENLSFEYDELENLKTSLTKQQRNRLHICLNLLDNFRQYLSIHYGLWSLVNLKTCQLLKEHFKLKTGLEVMAGNAMWGAGFKACGCEIKSTDDLSWSKTSETGSKKYLKVEDLDAIAALKQYGTKVDFIIWSWSPNFGNADVKFLEEYRKLRQKPVLLMIGEYRGATNTSSFWYRAKLKRFITQEISKSFASFDFINEQIMVVS